MPVAATTRTYSPNIGSVWVAASMSFCTCAAVGGCCSRWGWEGAEASCATLRPTSPQRTAWFSAARTTAWIWRIVAGARPRFVNAVYSPSRWRAVSFDSRTSPMAGRSSRSMYLP